MSAFEQERTSPSRLRETRRQTPHCTQPSDSQLSTGPPLRQAALTKAPRIRRSSLHRIEHRTVPPALREWHMTASVPKNPHVSSWIACIVRNGRTESAQKRPQQNATNQNVDTQAPQGHATHKTSVHLPSAASFDTQCAHKYLRVVRNDGALGRANSFRVRAALPSLDRQCTPMPTIPRPCSAPRTSKRNDEL